MGELRGRPLGFVALTLAAWIGGRFAWENGEDPLPFVAPSAARAVPVAASPPPHATATTAQRSPRPTRHNRTQKLRPINFRPPPALDPWQDGGRSSGLPFPALVAGRGEPLSTGRDTPPSNALAPVGKAGQPEFQPRRWGGSVYAYSFWRFSTGNAGSLAPGAQYGGSQSGLIGTVDPFGDPGRGLAFLARVNATSDGSEREAALGFRWKPFAKFPLSLSAERRLRDGAPDAFATYLAGGLEDASLFGKIRFSAYGQGGFVSGSGGGGFFDGNARIMHPITDIAGIKLSAGAGSWAGGQKGVHRLDAGPTIEARIDTSLADFRLQLDWRQRLEGSARPKQGLAFTVSTGF